MNLGKRHEDIPVQGFDSALYYEVNLGNNPCDKRAAVNSYQHGEVLVGCASIPGCYLEGRVGTSDEGGFRLVRSRGGLLSLGVAFEDLTRLFIPKNSK